MRHAAESAVERIVAPAVGHHRAEAAREEYTATALDRRVTSRDRHQQATIETNQYHAPRRDALMAAVEGGRAAIARHRQVRARRVATMTPDQVALADGGRTAYLVEQTRQHQLVAPQEHTLAAHEQARIPPPIERGPRIEM